MKKVYYFIILLLCISSIGFAQADNGQPRDFQKRGGPPPNLEMLKTAFVTRQLALTSDEAQKFWPVYYSYTDEIKKTRRGSKDDVLAMEENMLNVRKKYKVEFKKVLNTDERANKALTVDRDFMNEVRKELQKRQMKGQPKEKPKEMN
jgi:hypothetical protein